MAMSWRYKMTPEASRNQEIICRVPLAIARERLPVFLSQSPFNIDARWIEIEDVENGFELMCPFQGKTDGKSFALHLRMIDEKWCRRLYFQWSGADADSQAFTEHAEYFFCRLLAGEHPAATGSGIGYPDAGLYAMDALLSCLRTADGPFTFAIDNIDEQATDITIVTTLHSKEMRASVVFHIQDIKETSSTIRVVSTVLSDAMSMYDSISLDGQITSWLNQALLAGTIST